VIAPEADDKILFFSDKKRIALHKRKYESGEAGSYQLVISATNDSKVNEKIYQDAVSKCVPVNVVDVPQYCDFLFPAVFRRDCLSVAVTTDSKAPFLSAHLRMILEGMFDEKWEKIGKYAREFRVMAMERWSGDRIKKNQSFENFLNADWKTLLEMEKDKEIRIIDEFEKFLSSEVNPEMVMEFGPDKEEREELDEAGKG
jgi:siroheme synthase-like protein